MMTHTISFRGDQMKVSSPIATANPGDILVVLEPFYTKAGFQYRVNDHLIVKRRTTDAPFGLLSSLGNCVIEDRFHTSVWSNIDWMLAMGTIAIETLEFQ